MLVLDVSGSMAANDSQPTRLGAARAAALRYVDELPKRLPDVRGHVLRSHDARVAADARPRRACAPRSTRARTGPAGNGARRRGLPRGRGRDGGAGEDGQAAAGRDRRLLRRRADCGTRHAAAGGAAGGSAAHPGHDGRRSARPTASSQQPVKGGYTERIQVPVKPTVLQSIATASGGQFVDGARAVDVEVDVRRARLAGRAHAARRSR